MSGLRRLLSPGWLLGLLAVAVFAWACFTVLAPWQLGKSDQLDARNSRLTESVRADPVPYAEATADPEVYRSGEWRLVTTRGGWEPGSEVLLRLRNVDSDLVYQVLTVFRTDTGDEVLVNRGYVPVGDDNAVPAYPPAPAGPVEITARLRAPESGATEPIDLGGHTMVRSVAPTEIGSLVHRPLVTDGYLQLTGDQPGSLTPAPIPAIETGPYFSYGLQWIAFGVLAPLALGYFAWQEIRQRSRARQRAAAGAPTAGAPTAAEGEAETAPDTLPSTAVETRGRPRTDDGAPHDMDSHDVDSHGREAPESEPEPEPDPDELVARARERALAERYGERFDAERRRATRRGDRLRDHR